MRSIKESMLLCEKCLIAWLDTERDFFPTGGWEIAHDTGRWWDGMLRLEAVTEYKIPIDIERKMLRNLKKLMNNQYGMLINTPDVEVDKDKMYFNPHNFREGMLALTALVVYRDNEWARHTGHRFLEALDRFMLPDGKVDLENMAKLIDYPIRPSFIRPENDLTNTTGRALEAIVRYYRATQEPLALKVAERIAQYHLKNTVRGDGFAAENIVSSENRGHNHSYLGTLRGLLLLGFLKNSDTIVKTISKTYDNSIWKNNITWSGWAPHDLGMIQYANKDGDPLGDPASCGDVAQIALWLALQYGRTELLDDVERLVRGRLIPSQNVDDPNPRNLGAWGIYQHPFGRGSILDVFAAVLHTLTDIQWSIVTELDDNTIDINMHFDTENELADVSVDNADRRVVHIIIKKKAKTRIRIPGWVDRKNLGVKVNGNLIQHIWEGNYLVVAPNYLPLGSEIEVKYNLPITDTVETMKVSKKKYILTWRGDEVIECNPSVPIYS